MPSPTVRCPSAFVKYGVFLCHDSISYWDIAHLPLCLFLLSHHALFSFHLHILSCLRYWLYLFPPILSPFSSSCSSSSSSRHAIDLIAEIPPIASETRIVSCDGGGGALGHPKVFINLDKPGNHSCGYCGLRFYLDHHH